MTAAERPVVVTFKRREFYGDFAATDPKWHLLKEIAGDPKWGTHIAWCGYSKSNIIGDLTISRTKTKKKASQTCGRCLTAVAKHEKNNVPKKAV